MPTRVLCGAFGIVNFVCLLVASHSSEAGLQIQFFAGLIEIFQAVPFYLLLLLCRPPHTIGKRPKFRLKGAESNRNQHSPTAHDSALTVPSLNRHDFLRPVSGSRTAYIWGEEVGLLITIQGVQSPLSYFVPGMVPHLLPFILPFPSQLSLLAASLGHETSQDLCEFSKHFDRFVCFCLMSDSLTLIDVQCVLTCREFSLQSLLYRS